MSTITNFEEQFLLFVQNNLRLAGLNPFMLFITKLGDSGMIWIIITVLLLITKKYRKVGLQSGIALFFGLILTNLIIKNTVARIRPYEVIEGLKLLTDPASDWSFPSGHTTSSIASSVVLLYGMPRRYGVPALILGILISFSRLYIGIHYLSDVMAGALIGLLCAYIGLKLVEYVYQKLTKKSTTEPE